MPDLTSKKSETDADRRRNEAEYRRLTSPPPAVTDEQRRIFNEIAGELAPKLIKAPRHPAASDLFEYGLSREGVMDDDFWDNTLSEQSVEYARKAGERLREAREREVFARVFGCYPASPAPPPRPADVIDADYTILKSKDRLSETAWMDGYMNRLYDVGHPRQLGPPDGRDATA